MRKYSEDCSIDSPFPFFEAVQMPQFSGKNKDLGVRAPDIMITQASALLWLLVHDENYLQRSWDC